MSIFDPSAYSLSLTAALVFFASAAILLLGVYDFTRERVTRTSRSFFLITLSAAVWLFGMIFVYLAQDPGVALFWARFCYLGVPFIGASTYQFTVTVLRIYPRQKYFVWAGWLLALAFSVTTLSTDYIVNGVRQYSWGYYASYNWPGIFLIAFLCLMLLGSMWHYVSGYRRATPGKHKFRLRALIGAFGVGYLALIDFAPVYGIPLYPFGYIAIFGFVLLASRAIQTYRLDDITPALAAAEIIDTMSDALLVLNAEGKVGIANHAASQLFGFSAEELLDQPIGATIGAQALAIDLANISETGKLPLQEVEFVRKDGATRFLSLSASVKRNRRSAIVAIVCIARDITERKRAENEIQSLNASLEQRVSERTAQLQQANDELAQEINERKRAEQESERLLKLEQTARVQAEHESKRSLRLTEALDRALAEAHLLNAVAIAAAGHEDLRHILDVALDNLSQVIPFSGGSIALVEGDDLIVRAAVGPFAAEALGAKLPRGRGKSWEIVSKAQPFLSHDLQAGGFSSTTPVRSFLAVPLVWTDGAFGLLEVDASAANAFDEADLALMQKVAGALSGSIQLARLYGQTEQAHRREQQRAEQLRRLSDASISINSTLLLDEIMQVITDQARETIGAHQALTTFFAGNNGAGLQTTLSLSGMNAPPVTESSSAIYDLFSANNRPVRLTQAELAAHPAAVIITRANSLQFNGWLAAPLTDRTGHRLGQIELSDKREGEFTAQDEDILLQLAQMATVAVENARLYREAEEAVHARETLLSVVSHDMRNLLTAVSTSGKLLQHFLGGVELPARGQIDAGLKRIDSASFRMNGLIGDLLDFARLQAGQPLDLYYRRTDLVALARRLAAEHQDNTENHQIVVRAELDQLVGLMDTPRIERVFDNLLSNAIKYSPRGGEIEVSVARDPANPDWALLTVRDCGVGIPAADLPHVFDLFHRSNNVASRISGSGIGLASVAQVVAQHGGSIDVQSAESVGSTFTIHLPLTR